MNKFDDELNRVDAAINLIKKDGKKLTLRGVVWRAIMLRTDKHGNAETAKKITEHMHYATPLNKTIREHAAQILWEKFKD